MTPDAVLADAVLRLVGAFYAFGSIVGAFMVTRYAFLDHALEAISGKKAPWAERFRERLMLAGLIPVFAGGLALMAMSPIAPWLFAFSVIWQALYLAWFAPRFLDPHDDPGAEGRAKTWRAFWMYLGATAIVLAAAFAGLLRGPSGPGAAGVIGLAAAVFGGWAFWRMRNSLKPGGSPFSALSDAADPSDGWDNLSESGFKIREAADISVILRPSWSDGAIFSADTGNPVSYGWQEQHLSEFARDMITHIDTVFRDCGDPFDPRRCALRSPDKIAALEEAAQPALDLLRKELGPARVRFEPLPEPVPPVMVAARVKIEPYEYDSAIWSLDEPIDQPPRAIYEDHFGISWFLARSLGEWVEDWRLAQDPEAPAPMTPPAKWTPADFDEHEERGRVLAVRLKRELEATGRGHVMVYYPTRAQGLLEAHADADIPPHPERSG